MTGRTRVGYAGVDDKRSRSGLKLETVGEPILDTCRASSHCQSLQAAHPRILSAALIFRLKRRCMPSLRHKSSVMSQVNIPVPPTLLNCWCPRYAYSISRIQASTCHRKDLLQILTRPPPHRDVLRWAVDSCCGADAVIE